MTAAVDEAALRKQLEFYFGDSNFRRDKFMQQEAGKHEEGFISIETLLTFNRLKALLGGCDDPTGAVAAAVKTSETIVVSADAKALRRKAVLPEVDDSAQRTVFAATFPKDAKLEEIQDCFQAFGAVDFVKMLRRAENDEAPKVFTGSVFVEFQQAAAANAASSATEVLFNEAKLVNVSFKAAKHCPSLTHCFLPR